VDEFLTLIIFFIVIGLVERVLRAAQKTKGEPPARREAQPHDEGATEQLPAGLQDLIAEELGINLERRPRVTGPPEPPSPPPRTAPEERPAHQRGRVPVAPSRREPTVLYPSPVEPAPVELKDRPTGRGAVGGRMEETLRRRRAEFTRREAALTRRSPLQAEPARPLEERALLERGEAVSLEEPRRPEDHDRFHDLYMVQEVGPVVRRRRGPLPDRRDWSAAQKAIIWAEILGPPKGLGD
jgi:hypothetical protein